MNLTVVENGLRRVDRLIQKEPCHLSGHVKKAGAIETEKVSRK